MAASQGLIGDPTSLSDYAPPPLPDVRLPDGTRMKRYLDVVAAKANDVSPQLAGLINCSKRVLLLLFRIAVCVSPLYVWLLKWLRKIYLLLPTNIIQMLCETSRI